MKIFNFATLAMVGAVLAGCSVTGGDLVRPGETANATLIVVNQTNGYLDAVVISSCDNFTYGFNRLTDGDSIPPGGERSFGLSSGCWDVGGGEYAGVEAYKRMTIGPNTVMRYVIYE